MGKVILFSNLKGGVGKTTDTDITAVVASQLFHRKVLLIDVDMQANSTSNMSKTFKINNFNQSFASAVVNGSLKPAIMSLSPNLDFIAGSSAESEINTFITTHSQSKSDEYRFFKPMIDEVKDDYDYIFFDIAPSIDNTVFSILYNTDYVIAVQEVKRFSMDGTSVLISKLKNFYATYKDEGVHYEVLGILPAILQPRRKQQLKNYQETINQFGKSNVFSTIIKHHDRIEGFEENGISLNDIADRKIWALYADLFTEIEARIKYNEQNGDNKGFEYQLQYYDSKVNKTLDKGKEIDYHHGINPE